MCDTEVINLIQFKLDNASERIPDQLLSRDCKERSGFRPTLRGDLPDHVRLLWPPLARRSFRIRASASQYARRPSAGTESLSLTCGIAKHGPAVVWAGPEHREIVLAALQERCLQQRWELLAAHVRTNHVHVVVEAEVRPERIMNDLKSYASRCLNQRGLDEPARKRWARHGSTRWLWKPEHVSAAVRYAVDEQGEAMAVFEAAAP